MTESIYKKNNPLEKRLERVQSQLEKYPEMVPIILERAQKCHLKELKKKKYLVGDSYSLTQFKTLIKSKLDIQDQKGTTVFLYCGKTLLNYEMKMKDVYQKYKDQEDGFLYLVYADTQVYGSE